MNMDEFTKVTDKYHFKCTSCGRCCTGGQKVFLNLYDLCKLGRYHKYESSRMLFDAGRVVLVKDQNQSYLPRIRFKLKPFQFCPYLLNIDTDPDTFRTKCSLHPDNKPLICFLAPLGRVIDLDREIDEYLYINPAPDCPGIESDKENMLSAAVSEFEQELKFQYRFFKILKKAANNELSRQAYLEDIYYFDLRQDFETILAGKENF